MIFLRKGFGVTVEARDDFFGRKPPNEALFWCFILELIINKYYV